MWRKVYLLLSLFVLSESIRYSKATSFANDTTFTTEFKGLNTTMLSTTEVNVGMFKSRYPDECSCKPLEMYSAVKCKGENIKSIEQLDLPELTMSL